MDMTIDQQVAMDKAFVPHARRLFWKFTCRNSGRQLRFIITLFDSRWTTRSILHRGAIRRLTDVNINKLHQPWKSFAAIINKCLTEKSSGYDSLRLSQAQILWGLYHKRNVDFAYLMWKDFVYQVEHKDTKKSNEMYYLRFTKVIIHHFMSKDPSIPRRNKVNWHYVRDDHMFTTIKLVSRHQLTQQFGAMLPIELTNADIRNYDAYKEYHAVATGATPPKTKASPATISKAKSPTALSEVAMAEAQQLKLATKRNLQQTHISQASGSSADEGTGSISGVPDVPTEESDEEISWKSSDEEGDDDEEEGDDDKEGNDNDDAQDDDDHEDEGDDDKDDQEEGSDDEQAFDKEDEEFIYPSLSTHDEEKTRDEESFDPILKTPENTDNEGNGEENLITNVGWEEGHDEEDEEDELYRDVNINLGRGTVNEQLEAEVLTRSSNSSKSSYTVAADLSEMELEKILIEKMEGNKSIHRSNEQRNLYKALVEVYESDKIILDTYGDTITLKRRHDDDADKDKEPSAGSDQGPRYKETERSQSQQALQRRKLLGALASRHKGLNLDKSRQASLQQQRSQCKLPMRWKSPYIQSLKQESARDVYSKRRIITVTELKIVEWHNYKHLDWITVRRDDDNLYKFKEVEERFAFNVSLRMFTRSIVIQRRMEELQLGVESYQKKLNLTRPDTYRSNLKRKEAYIAYSNPRGFIYRNKDKHNRLMRIDELHKFNDGMLTDVRTALDDRLKGIRMKYLPQSIWRKSDKDRAATMIQAIDKQLKTRRIMRSLERFLGGRLYEGDFRMLQRTI
uniref:Uncharacterized protein n=1 Tax=Tanacetum cinerariifolium TaxID=118510 RepID=A0A6L2JAV5_TANCI|nr:hypothetical protein [Tanacetum cinerariifolium]